MIEQSAQITQGDLVDLGLMFLVVVLVGLGVAFILFRTNATARGRKHKRISASRRGANTAYDLFAPKAEGEQPSSGRRRRRRRSSASSSRGKIDLFDPAGGAGDGETGER
jgi:predicted lipid-binding transport protein (Tim44 family)